MSSEVKTDIPRSNATRFIELLNKISQRQQIGRQRNKYERTGVRPENFTVKKCSVGPEQIATSQYVACTGLDSVSKLLEAQPGQLRAIMDFRTEHLEGLEAYRSGLPADTLPWAIGLEAIALKEKIRHMPAIEGKAAVSGPPPSKKLAAETHLKNLVAYVGGAYSVNDKTAGAFTASWAENPANAIASLAKTHAAKMTERYLEPEKEEAVYVARARTLLDQTEFAEALKTVKGKIATNAQELQARIAKMKEDSPTQKIREYRAPNHLMVMMLVVKHVMHGTEYTKERLKPKPEKAAAAQDDDDE